MNKIKLVRGLGVYEKGTFKVTLNGKISNEYQLWDSMLARCQTKMQRTVSRQSYKGCTIHKDFIHFQDFAEWCQSQIGFDESGWQLDKDILVPGNKVYGPDTCCFVPNSINTMMTIKQEKATPYPPGVCLYKPTGKFKSAIGIEGKTKNLGYYDTPDEAYAVYKVAKLIEIHRTADKWRDRIDRRVYDALSNFKF